MPLAVTELIKQEVELEVAERQFEAELRDPKRAVEIAAEVAGASKAATPDPDTADWIRSTGEQSLAVLRRLHKQGKQWAFRARIRNWRVAR